MNNKQRTSTKPIVEFHGWISGDMNDRELLSSLGVTGEMKWEANGDYYKETGKRGVFTYCTITAEISEKLKREYDAYWSGCFTAIDEDGEQTISQPLWKEGKEGI